MRSEAFCLCLFASACAFQTAESGPTDSGRFAPSSLDAFQDRDAAPHDAADGGTAEPKDAENLDAPPPADALPADDAQADSGNLDAIPALDAPAPDAPAPDAASDAGSPDSSCGWSYAPANVDPCSSLLPQSGQALDLNGMMNAYDSDMGVLSTGPGQNTTPPSVVISPPNGPMARVVVVDGLRVNGSAVLRVNGMLPVVFLINGSVTVSGAIVAQSGGGAGGCPTIDGAATANDGAGGGGGGGGGLAMNGGSGGDGSGPGNGHKGMGGAMTAALPPLRGGCPGGNGGDVMAGTFHQAHGGMGGRGGGALQISARDTLTLSGSIDASGGGGKGGESDQFNTDGAGGGGGGSGGSMLFEGRQVIISGIACANGGSGGQGGLSPGTPGDGVAGLCAIAPAVTTNHQGAGGGAGNGGFHTTAPQNAANGQNQGGGGGGGGSVGRIRIHSMIPASISGVLTPPPQP